MVNGRARAHPQFECTHTLRGADAMLCPVWAPISPIFRGTRNFSLTRAESNVNSAVGAVRCMLTPVCLNIGLASRRWAQIWKSTVFDSVTAAAI